MPFRLLDIPVKGILGAVDDGFEAVSPGIVFKVDVGVMADGPKELETLYGALFCYFVTHLGWRVVTPKWGVVTLKCRGDGKYIVL
jgi:hypothetical protein